MCFCGSRKNVGEGFDSDSQSPKQSDSEEAPKPRKVGRPRKNAPSKPEAVSSRAATSRRAKAKVVYEEEDDDDEEEGEEEQEEEEEEQQPPPKQQKQQKQTSRSKPQPAKAGVRQTKMEDFSPKGRGGGGKTLNGGSTKGAVTGKSAAQKGSGRGSSSQTAVVKRFVASPPAVSPNRSRTMGAESDDSMSSSKGGDDRPSPAVVRRLKPPMLRENM